MQPSTFEIPLVKKEKSAKDVMTFYFDRTKVPNYDFLPGQYNRVIIPDVKDDPRGNSRMFSIASSPTSKEFLMITTKISDSKFKQTFASLSEGDTVQFFGPVGRFVLDEKETGSHVFLAGGIGLTPFHSMLMYAADTMLSAEFILIVSFSTPEEMIYFEEIKALSENHPNIHIIYSLTQADKVPSDWKGETGRINADMISKHVPNHKDALFYICGSQVVTKALEEVVLQMNIKAENIRKEQFVGY